MNHNNVNSLASLAYAGRRLQCCHLSIEKINSTAKQIVIRWKRGKRGRPVVYYTVSDRIAVRIGIIDLKNEE